MSEKESSFYEYQNLLSILADMVTEGMDNKEESDGVERLTSEGYEQKKL